MKHLIIFLFAAAAWAQQAQPVKPAPPTTVTLRIVVDGTPTAWQLKPAAIETLNNLFHAANYTGTFGERFVAWLKQSQRQLSVREEYAPAAVKTKLDALKAAQAAAAAEADATAEEKP